MRVFFSSQFDTFSGYGNDAVDIAVHLSRQGIDVVPWATKVLPGLPREFTDLLTEDPSGSYDVVLSFAPPFDTRPDDLVRFAPKTVGWSMWETSAIQEADMRDRGFGGDEIPEDAYVGRWWSWSRHRAVDHKGLDLMLVTCPMNIDAFRAVDEQVALDVLPCGVDTSRWPMLPRSADRRMRFGMIGMLGGRKDPWAMIQAWVELKQERPDFDAVLELKTLQPGLHPKMVDYYPDLVIHDRAWSPQQVLEWYQSVDVLVSTSRGEGNNKPAMEFMATGGPVIATDWSGHQNWLYPSSGYPVSGELHPVGPNSTAQEFRVSIPELKRTILHTWENRQEVLEKGRLSHGVVTSSLSWEKVTEQLVRKLGGVLV